MWSDPGKRGRKLLILVSRAAKGLNDMSRGLRIARLIARFCLESDFIGKYYSGKNSAMSLRWLLVVFPCSANLSNYLRLDPHNNVRRQLLQSEGEVVPVQTVTISQFIRNVRNYSGWMSSKV